MSRFIRMSRLFAPTLREQGATESVPSYQLLMRGGFIRQSASGIYNLLPLALRVMEKLERIIDDELQAIGGQKLVMPSLLTAELWMRTGRWQTAGDEMFRLKDRKDAQFLLGPTHEEEITNLVASNVVSYRQLPLRLYQTGRKFRDEVRPRFGLMRGREFVMKDMYTFDLSKEAAMETYKDVCGAYTRIFQRIGLPFVQAEADTGTIGGTLSHEFQLISNVGEDSLLLCPCGKYVANVERAVSIAAPFSAADVSDDLSAITPQHVLDAVRWQVYRAGGQMLGPHIRIQVIDWGETSSAQQRMLAVVRADHSANAHAFKSAKPAGTLMAEPQVLNAVSATWDHCHQAPKCTIFVDEAAVDDGPLGSAPPSGSEEHPGVAVQVGNFRLAKAGDICPCAATDISVDMKDKRLRAVRGVEVGHAFYLGEKYSEKLDAHVLNVDQKMITMQMGCFGIGVSRLIAAIVEASHDTSGIVWPTSVAPYKAVVLVAMKQFAHDSKGTTANDDLHKLQNAALGLCETLSATAALHGEVILEDRDATLSFGSKMVEATLRGFPYIIILGREFLNKGMYELHIRSTGQKHILDLDGLVQRLQLP